MNTPLPRDQRKIAADHLNLPAHFTFVVAGLAVRQQGVACVAQPSPAAGSGTVSVRVPGTGGETPPQPTGEDACATSCP
ncbi:MAG TPA: hypothetical protein VK327_14045 [Candidatus Paceibacterota bacterium]|nr:hypothetical protein [Candidatus Paceibacterota bacterium]